MTNTTAFQVGSVLSLKTDEFGGFNYSGENLLYLIDLY